MKYLLVLFFIILGFYSCKKTHKNIYAQITKEHAAGQSKLYNRDKPWNQRVYQIDDIHLDFVKQLNQIDQIKLIPEKDYSALTRFENLVDEITKNEPDIVKKLKDRYIFGIYFCKNLGSTGLTGFVYEDNKPIGGFIIFDSDYLVSKGNSWISLKENSVFNTGKYDLQIQIESSEKDSYSLALEYIMLHELGHIVSIVEGFMPDFRAEERDFSSLSFTRNGWLNYKESKWDALIQNKDKIHFYGKPQITTNLALQVYEDLEKTPFPTLYGAMNPDDHFAESFVSYIHIYIYNKPWNLVLVDKEEKITHTFNNGIVLERCKFEKEFIQGFLAGFESKIE
jgi:hypothetical protein